jgi:hypothetical protein
MAHKQHKQINKELSKEELSRIDIKTIENDNTNSEQLLFVVILIKASKKAFIQT